MASLYSWGGDEKKHDFAGNNFYSLFPIDHIHGFYKNVPKLEGSTYTDGNKPSFMVHMSDHPFWRPSQTILFGYFF